MATNGKEVPVLRRMRAARLSAQQFEVMIQYMSEHPQFAAGRAGGSFSKEEHDMLWQELTDMLNDTDGPIKSSAKWQKCWVDLKSNARSRAAKLRSSSIDGRIPAGSTFTQWDERVLQLLSDVGCLSNDSMPSQDLSPSSPANLVEVSLTTGKVVLMEVNRGHNIPSPDLKYRPIAPKSETTNGVSTRETRTVKVEHLNGLDLSMNDEGEELEHHDGPENFHHMQAGGDIEDEHTADDAMSEPLCSPSDTLLPCPPLAPIRTSLLGRSLVRKFPHGRQREDHHDFSASENTKRRKKDNPLSAADFEEFSEHFSKNVNEALNRLASAAEESNVIQQGMVMAMNRLSATFEQLVPLLGKLVASGTDSNK